MAKLVFTEQGQTNEVVIGPQHPSVTIGRVGECEVRTVDTSVSRRHSRITHSRVGNEDVYELVDLNSSNGTFVNDSNDRITGQVRLRSNDRVKCGNFQLTFIDEPSMGAMPGPPSAGAPTTVGPGAAGFGPGPGGGLPGGGPPPGPPGMGPPGMGPPGMGGPPPPGMGPPGPGMGPPGPGMGPPGGGPGPGPGAGSGGSSSPGSVPYVDDPSIAVSPADLAKLGLGGSYPPPPSPEMETYDYRMPPGGGPPPGPPPRDYGYEDDRPGRYGYGDSRRLRDEVEALTRENEDLRKEDARIQAQMDALSDRNNELKDQFATLQNANSDLRDRLREAREDLDNALFKRDELASDVERLEADKVDLFDQLTKLKIEYNHLERAHEQSQKEHNLLEFEYKRLDEANQELERELRATIEGDSAQADVIQKLQVIVDEKDNHIHEMRDRLEDMMGQLKDRQEYDSTWMVEVENLKQENEQLRSDKEQLESRMSELQEDAAAGRADRAEAEAEAEEREFELLQLREDVERLRSRLKDSITSSTFSKYQEENEELRYEVKQLKEDLEEARANTAAGAEELLDQIRELTNGNHRLEAKLREQAATVSTSDGSVPAIDIVAKEKLLDTFTEFNSVVSGWRANLETMQIHVEDLTSLFDTLGDEIEDLDEEIKNAIDETDPDWACESMAETVEQILEDTKRIKTMLLEVREDLSD